MRSLLGYFALTFVASWTLWAGAAVLTAGSVAAGTSLTAFDALLFLPGTVMPALVALALSARAGGSAGWKALLGQIFRAPAAARWYVFALTYMVAVKLTVAVVHRGLTGAWPAFGSEPWYLMAAAIAVSTPAQSGEEIGWRGYALPRLAGRLGLPLASLVLGGIWAVWHLPLFLIPGSDNYGKSFPVYVLAVTALSVAMAWLYWRTQGNLLLTMLMHAAVNNTAGIVASPATASGSSFSLEAPLVAWLTAIVLGLGAVGFLIGMGRKRTLGNERPGLGPPDSA